HYDTSLREGSELLSHVFSFLSSWKPVDIFIDRNGTWHAEGIPSEAGEIRKRADVFWDTTRSNAYVDLGAPVANVSGGYSTFTEKGRNTLREHVKDLGIKLPGHLVLPAYQPDIDGPLAKYAAQKAKQVFEKFSPPWRVRLYPGD